MGRPKLVTDDKLLAAARSVFTRDGAAGSTREIADRAGISEAALFKRLGTKAGLFLAAMKPPEMLPGAIVAEAESAADPRRALLALADALLDYFRRLIPVMLPLVQNPLIGPETLRHHFGEPAVGNLMVEVAGYLRTQRKLGRIAASADPNAVAGLLIATAHSIAQFEVIGLHAGAVPKAGLRALVDTLWRGLEPDGAGQPRVQRP